MKLTLFCLLLLHATASQIVSITLGTIIPNRITYYKWIIKQPEFIDENGITFYFDPLVLVLDSCVVTINGVQVSRSNTLNQLSVSSGSSQQSTTIIITDVQNPPYQMQSLSFYYHNRYNDNVVTYSTPIKYMFERKDMYLYGSLLSILWIIGVICCRFMICRKECYQPYFIISFTSLLQTAIYIFNTFFRSNQLLYVGEDLSNQISSILTTLYVVGGIMLLRNICYFIYFLIYVRQKMDRISSWNCVFCNITAMVAALTSFEVGYLSYSKAFSFPFIPVRFETELIPMHRISSFNIVFINITLIVLSVIGAIKSDFGGNNFLLFVDLGLITCINTLVTVFFLTKQKPQSYYINNQQGVTDKTEAQLNPRRVGDVSILQLIEIKQTQMMKTHEQAFKWMVLSIDF